MRLSRDARAVVPYFELAPYLLVNTDPVFTTAGQFAEHVARPAAARGQRRTVRLCAHALLPAVARTVAAVAVAPLVSRLAVGCGAAMTKAEPA